MAKITIGDKLELTDKRKFFLKSEVEIKLYLAAIMFCESLGTARDSIEYIGIFPSGPITGLLPSGISEVTVRITVLDPWDEWQGAHKSEREIRLNLEGDFGEKLFKQLSSSYSEVLAGRISTLRRLLGAIQDHQSEWVRSRWESPITIPSLRAIEIQEMEGEFPVGPPLRPADSGPDGPTCPSCGNPAVRDGAIYKCTKCGESLGVS
jgi:hypothetical protein